MDMGTRQSQAVPEKSASLRDEIYEQIREEIITLKRPPGAPLSDKVISLELEVSRTPVREAMLKLVDEGLVQVFPQIGTFVAKIYTPALKNAQFIRLALERTAIRNAAGNATQRNITALGRIIEQQQKASESDPGVFYRLDENFHRYLFDVSGHSEAWGTVLRAKSQLDRVRYLGLIDRERMTDIIREHGEILAAVAEKDPVKSEASMEMHLEIAYRNIMNTIEKYSTFFS